MSAATKALADVRTALKSCAEHTADGVTVRWQTKALSIGDESLFVGAQRFLGNDALDGNFRGTVTRVGRTTLTYLDSGGRSHAMSPSEINSYVGVDHAMADKLDQAGWAK